MIKLDKSLVDKLPTAFLEQLVGFVVSNAKQEKARYLDNATAFTFTNDPTKQAAAMEAHGAWRAYENILTSLGKKGAMNDE